MPGCKRLAIVATPLLALIAALLLGWSVAAAQAPDPLTLTLTAERSECTAGTLNPASWTISGGTAPYTLTVAGQTVEPAADGVNVTCDALPEGASEAPGTIRAVVTDGGGATATTSAAYTVVPPLPAPVARAVPRVWRFAMGLSWEGLTVPASCAVATGCYAFRTRLAGATQWRYSWDEHRNTHLGWPPRVFGYASLPGTTFEAGIAAMRDPIEIETPEALHWSATARATSLTDISGLTATATHDTVTVRWDRQPSADVWVIGIRGLEPQVSGGQSKRIKPRGSADRVAGWGDPMNATHEVAFTDLPPDTEYQVLVEAPVYAAEGGPRHIVASTTTVRTAVAPADYTPLPRGPQNLRATATRDTITVSWDHPRPVVDESPGVDYGIDISGPPGTLTHEHWRARVYPPATAYTYTGLAPGTTYHIQVTHYDITRESAEITVTTTRWARSSLPLTLTVGRSECTAGTLTPVTWEISGGVEPYRLRVDGASVDPNTEGATATCGALPEGATEAPGTITARVTDDTGATATASAAYTIVPPLPAPVATAVPSVMPLSVQVAWEDLTVPASCEVATGCYAFRTRLAGETSWDYNWDEHRHAGSDWPPVVSRSVPGGTTVEAGIASMRDPIEIETPEALRWSATAHATSLADISGLTVTATYDTVTVRWNRQTSADRWWASIGGPVVRGRQVKTIASRGPADWVAGWGDPTSATHEVTFTDLPPDTEFQVTVWGPHIPEAGVARALEATTAVRTAVAPAGYTPLPRGPQNLRATATHDTITVQWDHPWPDTENPYTLRLSGPLRREVTQDWWDTVVLPPDSQHTFPYLLPTSTYRIWVTHNAIAGGHAEITVRTKLGLELTVERAECTAGTLNLAHWRIMGGTPPYTRAMAGATADWDPDLPGGTARLACETLPEGETEAVRTITASVTDAEGETATASTVFTIVPALPAPETAGAIAIFPDRLVFDWYSVETPPGGDTLSAFQVRWREVGGVEWTYQFVEPWTGSDIPYRVLAEIEGLHEGVAYEVAVAAMRHGLSWQTPDALHWTPSRQATTGTSPLNVAVTTTHDTMTVRWDRQPFVTSWEIRLLNIDGSAMTRISAADADGWGDPESGTHEVTFEHLSPDTQYSLVVSSGSMDPRLPHRFRDGAARTKAAPADYSPLPRGPQNLRATSTATSVTVTWDAPFAGATPSYTLYIYAPDGTLLYEQVDEPPWRLTFGSPNAAESYLSPGTTYRIVVRHRGLVRPEAEISIATQAQASASPTVTCIEYLVGAMICA